MRMRWIHLASFIPSFFNLRASELSAGERDWLIFKLRSGSEVGRVFFDFFLFVYEMNHMNHAQNALD